METIGEEALSALPPPHTPLAAIPSREDVIENKGKKGKKKKDGFTEFDKPFSQNGDAQQDELEELQLQSNKEQELRIADGEQDDLIGVEKIFPQPDGAISLAEEAKGSLKCLCEHPPSNRDI